MGQIEASALDVAQHLEASAVCADIKTFLNELVSLT
jgi:hypothetical protein